MKESLTNRTDIYLDINYVPVLYDAWQEIVRQGETKSNSIESTPHFLMERVKYLQ